MFMKKQLLIGIGWMLAMVGLLTTCFAGCRSTQPEPEIDQTTTTTATASQISTTTTITAQKPIPTTTKDPMGYEDITSEEDWPWRIFNSIEGFIHWIENPDFKIEESPLEPEKDQHGYDVYKLSYFDALYPDYQQMFAVDRFYMLPDVPDDWEAEEVHVSSYSVTFYYQDPKGNQYHLGYNYHKSSENLSGIEDSELFAFKKTLNNQEYYITDYDSKRVAAKKGHYIHTLVNGYSCEFGEITYNPEEKDSVMKGYESVVYSEDTDLTDAVSKIKFKRIDLPPLK